MKTASMILSVLTILMALSELTCGLWLQSHGADPSSLSFHTRLGIGTVVMTLVTIVITLIYAAQR